MIILDTRRGGLLINIYLYKGVKLQLNNEKQIYNEFLHSVTLIYPRIRSGPELTDFFNFTENIYPFSHQTNSNITGCYVVFTESTH